MYATHEHWIKSLNLTPHPEGGFYRETYRSDITFDAESVSDRFKGKRCCSTAIYFLLTEQNFSGFHRIKADELWHFYEGSSLTIHIISPEGVFYQKYLGNNPYENQHFQVEVKAGYWFAASLTDHKGYSLVGCTTAPGFEFEDFELAERKTLCNMFPEHKAIITRYTRQ